MKKLSLLLMVALLSVATWAQSDVILSLNRAIFSTTYGEKWLRLSCCDNTDYVWSATSSKEAKTALLDTSQDSQLFCFVGNETDGFAIYNKALGEAYKLTALSPCSHGEAASWTQDEAATWYLDTRFTEVEDKPGFGITTNKENQGMSLNMWGGNGGDLKFYSMSGAGSRWIVTQVDQQ